MDTVEEENRDSYESLYGDQGTFERIIDEVQTSLSLLTAITGVLLVVVGAVIGSGTIAGLVAIYGFAAIILGLLGYGTILALQRL
jgi:VIT1/CCC1 family predicted Fe2+/Mn2+ transporter